MMRPRPSVATRPWQLRMQALGALGLDVTYERGSGSCLYQQGDTRPVWDFLGGYGSTFFGHNHPALTAALIEFVTRSGVVHAQASARSASDEVCDRLAERLHAAVGVEYRVMLASTGAEAVEVAAKHAELAYGARRERLLESTQGRRSSDAAPPWTREARHMLTGLGLWAGHSTLAAIQDHNRRELGAIPCHVALRGSFHGMTARALELTHDPDHCFGTRASSSPVKFIDPTRGDALSQLLESLTRTLLKVRASGDRLDVETIPWTPAVAFFMEPLQGEGGIHPIAGDVARAWQAECATRGIPLIADEIQSGMGRTGTFLYSEQLGLQPDYVLLGKSLGGGLVKISAVAVRHEQYLAAFSLKHASTFADDDLSSHVARRALELLDSESAMGVAREKGQTLRHALTELAERHPTIIKDVRGCGLMLGVEWRDLDFDRSLALRLLQQDGWLGYALSGYLLRAHRVRIAPALSRGMTLRLEPAHAVPDEAIRQLLDGLDHLCVLLEHQDAAGILGPCIGSAVQAPRERTSRPIVHQHPPAESHVGFVGHFIDPSGVALWDPNFRRLDPDACRIFLERIHPFAEPVLCHREQVRSVTGDVTTLSFVGIPITSQHCYDALRTSGRHALRDLVQRAVDFAAGEGCSVVGLGGYCSILTRNGKDLRANGMSLTTGSGFTVGAGLIAMRDVASAHGVVWERARAAVIGASGNIGSVVGSLLAHSVGSIVLLGRPAGLETLRGLAGAIVRAVLRDASDSPIGRLLREGGVDAPNGLSTDAIEVFGRAKRLLGDAMPIDVGTDLAVCRTADLIAAVSNYPDSLLYPEHLGDSPTVIIDLALPGDVDDSVARERPNARVIRGGVIRTPRNPDWLVPGIPLERGEMFACMTETVLMGLERARDHGSFGSLTAERVHRTVAMAQKHGFTRVRTRTDQELPRFESPGVEAVRLRGTGPEKRQHVLHRTVVPHYPLDLASAKSEIEDRSGNAIEQR